jgi:MATE family multidrug resistance protein
MVWGLPPAIGFLYLRQIAAAINFSQFGLVNIFISLILVVPTNYLLMFGYLGFPALGLAGLGWGNTLIFWINFLASVSVIYFHPKSRDYRLFQHLLQFDKKLFLQIFLAGWPTGIQTGIEQGLYMITAILVGSIDTDSLAGHEIAIQTAEFFLTIPVAISHATTARIGLRLGENNIIGAMRAFVVNLTFGILFAVVVAIGFDCFTLDIVSIYLDINDPDNAAAIGWSTSFLFLAGISQIFYSIQFITIGALIGLQDTLIPMLITLISFWGLGLGGGYLMAINWGWGGIGFWYGLILAPAVSGIIFIVRFYKKSVEQFSQIQI